MLAVNNSLSSLKLRNFRIGKSAASSRGETERVPNFCDSFKKTLSVTVNSKSLMPTELVSPLASFIIGAESSKNFPSGFESTTASGSLIEFFEVREDNLLLKWPIVSLFSAEPMTEIKNRRQTGKTIFLSLTLNDLTQKLDGPNSGNNP